MKLRLPLILIKVITLSSHAFAGGMYDHIGVDQYRDLALNVGIFEKGATNVQLYNKDGSLGGVIDVVPDLGATSDPHEDLYSSLAGGQSWYIGAKHTVVAQTVSFSDKYGAAGTLAEQDYHTVQDVTDSSSGSLFIDLRIARFSKVVTDAVHYELPGQDESYYKSLESLQGYDAFRSGYGRQFSWDEEGNLTVHYEIGSLAAGSAQWDDVELKQDVFTDGRTKNEDGSFKLFEGSAYRITGKSMNSSTSESAIPITPLPGDSGSGSIVFNEATQSFQYIGATSFILGDTTDGFYFISYSPDFYNLVMNSSTHTLNANEDFWQVGSVDANGYVSLQSGSGVSEQIRVLKAGERGDTSTVGTRALDAELWASLDWCLNNGSTTIQFTDSLDTGAGSIQFKRALDTSASNEATYNLNSTSQDVHINSAGYIIEENVLVISSLTAQQGDEWRIVGENGRIKDGAYDIYGGTFILEGNGNNEANLNLGVGISVQLNRTGGYAANDVQLNTGAKLTLMQDKQINGKLIYGADGGTVFLNGFNLSYNQDTLFALDRKARIVNSTAAKESSFTYSFSSDEEMLVAFSDGASLGTPNDARLNLHFIGQAPEATLRLSNDITLAADVTLQGAKFEFANHLTAHAKADTLAKVDGSVYIYDENDWQTVKYEMGELQLLDSQLALSGELQVKTALRSTGANNSIQLDDKARLFLGDGVSQIEIKHENGLRIDHQNASEDLYMNHESFRNVHLQNASLSGVNNVSLESTKFTQVTLSQSQFNLVNATTISHSRIEDNVNFALSEAATLILENSVISKVNMGFMLQPGSLPSQVRLSHSTLEWDVAHESSQILNLADQRVQSYTLNGLGQFLDQLTLEGGLKIDLLNLYIERELADAAAIIFDDIAFGSATADLIQLLNVGQNTEINGIHNHEGMLMFSFNIVPEPSTASLSLLALSALLYRRRRRGV